MRPRGPIAPEGNFQGLLLVAHPGLKDPNFRRTVLLLSAHAPAAGASGLILNRPLGKTAAELLPAHDRTDLLERVPVYVGGPVAHDQMSFADLRWDGDSEAVEIRHNLSLEEVGERLEDGASGVRAFVGYAGWMAGQLEGELLQKAWVLVQPQETTIQIGKHGKLWFEIMASLGPMYKLLAAAPDDPSLN